MYWTGHSSYMISGIKAQYDKLKAGNNLYNSRTLIQSIIMLSIKKITYGNTSSII